MVLTRLGISKLWHDDPEVLWRAMRYFVRPVVTRWLAPGSFAYGGERVALSGGAVVAGNHLSAIDPLVLGAFCPRAIYFMAKAELLSMPVAGEILEWTGAFPVHRRQRDEEAIERGRELVREGHVICLFVETTRQRLGYPGRVHPRGLMIAMEERVPVIPFGLETFRWSLKNRRACTIVWGPSIDLAEQAEGDLQRGGHIIQSAVHRLWRQAAEAIVAGFPPTLPDGTRRSGPIPPGECAPRPG
jgi:1-acyl-sn-glycerol-3-phosphate acyltransferase